MVERWEIKDSVKRRPWRASTLLFVLFFFYAVLIWFCELADLACWLVGAPQVTVLSRIAAFFLAVLLFWKVIGIPKTEKTGMDPFFIIGSLIFAGFFALKGIRPDMSYDTQNYHLLSQIPGFADNLNFHVIPGRFQMYGFRLGDRMFYPFRAVLGLRMGTLLNAAAMIVIYRQLTVLLDWFKETLPDSGMKPGNPVVRGIWKLLTCPSILAFFIAGRFELLQESGSYMVELLALPFFLEMVFLLIRDTEEVLVKREAVAFCLMGGIFFCMKMTNIVYLAPLVLFYIVKIRKYITVPLFIGCLAAGAAPAVVYLVYNGICMGNPVYPYYNTIFQSPYFGNENFKDRRWGPAGVSEIFLWPWYMIRYPDYRLSELPCMFTLDLAAGYLAMAGLLAAGAAVWFRKKSTAYKKELVLTAVYLISLLAWTVTTGHIRYFMAGLILNGVLLAFAYLRLLHSRSAVLGLAGLVLAAPFLVRAPYGFSSVWKGHEWALRDANPDTYKKNAKWVFRDRQLFPQEVRDKVDVLFLTWSDCGSYARLIGEDVPVWNRYSVVGELSAYRDVYMERIEDYMRRGMGVYDMFPQGGQTLEEYLEWMNEARYYVRDLFYLDSILSGPQSYTMAGLELANGRENTWYYADYEETDAAAEDGADGAETAAEDGADGAETAAEDGADGTETAAEDGADGAETAAEEPADGTETVAEEPAMKPLRFMKKTDSCQMSAFVGDTEYWLAPFPFRVEVLASDGKAQKTAAVVEAGRKEYEFQTIPLDLAGLEGEITLTFRSLQQWKQAVIVNPQIEEDGGLQQ